MGLLNKIKSWLNKLFNEDMNESKRTTKVKGVYVCKDGRTVYNVKCRKCGKRTNTTDKETARRSLYVCSKCVPRKKKK